MLKGTEVWKMEEREIYANISWSFPFYLKYIFYSFNMEGDWMKENWVTQAEIILGDPTGLSPSKNLWNQTPLETLPKLIETSEMDAFHFVIMFWMNMLLNKTITKVSELLEKLLFEILWKPHGIWKQHMETC